MDAVIAVSFTRTVGGAFTDVTALHITGNGYLKFRIAQKARQRRTSDEILLRYRADCFYWLGDMF